MFKSSIIDTKPLQRTGGPYMLMKLLQTGTVVLLVLTFSLSGCLGRGGGGDGIDGRVPADVDGDDYNVLYIGHSFGRPFAELVEEYAHTAGIKKHAQYIEFSGGESGSPGFLWEDKEHQTNIKAFLDTGEIDVLVMICCSPEFIETLDTDLAIWNFTDYAVEKNPGVRIGLAMPWKDYPKSMKTRVSMQPTQPLTFGRTGETCPTTSGRIMLARTFSPSITGPSCMSCEPCLKTVNWMMMFAK